jgi:hypothetical protein
MKYLMISFRINTKSMTARVVVLFFLAFLVNTTTKSLYLFAVALPKKASASNAPDSVNHHFQQQNITNVKTALGENYHKSRVVM